MDKCVFQNSARGHISCSLEFYGGKPFLGNCVACIHLGENTEEHARRLHERHAKSHPDGVTRIGGCCDSARNYLTSSAI